jgi:phage gpG-like protein
MSVGVTIESPDLDRLQLRLLTVSRVKFTDLLHSIGGVVESQSRRRIQTEKRGPDGTPWRGWSQAYAASKHGPKSHERHEGQLFESQGHSLLSLSGSLLESLQSQVAFGEVEIGSNLIYANAQNETRPFLGLSKDNSDEVIEVIDRFLDREMRIA